MVSLITIRCFRIPITFLGEYPSYYSFYLPEEWNELINNGCLNINSATLLLANHCILAKNKYSDSHLTPFRATSVEKDVRMEEDKQPYKLKICTLVSQF